MPIEQSEIKKALEKLKLPELTYEYEPWLESKWIIDEPIIDEPYEIGFATREEYERTKAMIDFCTKYEPETFELFYKWFKKNNGKEG